MALHIPDLKPVSGPPPKKTIKQRLDGFAQKVLRFQSLILLTIVYYTAFGLTAIFFRLLSPYARMLRKRPPTMWHDREEPEFEKMSLKFQF